MYMYLLLPVYMRTNQHVAKVMKGINKSKTTKKCVYYLFLIHNYRESLRPWSERCVAHIFLFFLVHLKLNFMNKKCYYLMPVLYECSGHRSGAGEPYSIQTNEINGSCIIT